jgi:hypothetical protein
MGEKWMDRVKRVYKEKKDKDPNYKYSQAMSDAKIGYVAEGVATVKPAKTHRAKKQKGGIDSRALVPIASIPAPPPVIKGGKSRKNKKSRKSRKGGKAKKSRKRK